MSISKVVTVEFDFVGNGTDTVITLDLTRDPYVVLPDNNMSSPVPHFENWLTENGANTPASAQAVTTTGGALPTHTFSLAYPILTITFVAAPAVGRYSMNVELLF
jgi:hypothetical protein